MAVVGPKDSRQGRPAGDQPWSRLAQAPRLSFDLGKIVVAAVGLLLLQGGWVALDRLFAPAPAVTPDVLESLSNRPGPPTDVLSLARSSAWSLTEPARILVVPLRDVFAAGSLSQSLHALLAVIWTLVVWGIAGGAISRLALLSVAGRHGLGALGVLRQAMRLAVPLILTPGSQLAASLFFLLLGSLFGLVFWIPLGIGQVLGTLLLFIPLATGLLAAFLLLAMVAGWPLAHASVMAECQDTLDALSRVSSYLNQRTARYALGVVFLWILGIPCLLALDLLIGSALGLTEWGLRAWAPAQRPPDPGFLSSPGSAGWFWSGGVGLLARAWVYSYFWTAAAVLYLMLREDVDGTPWSDIHDPSREAPG